jgi:hypothetical protein
MNLRRRGAWFLPVLLGLAAPSLSGNGDGQGAWQPVHHPKAILYLPSDWEVRDEVADGVLEGVGPLSGPGDSFNERMVLGIERLPEGDSLEDFVDRSVDTLVDRLKEARLLRRAPARHGRNDGIEIELSHWIGDKETFLRMFFFRFEDHVYVVTQSGRQPDYDDAQDLFDAILAGIHPLPGTSGNVYFHRDFAIRFPESWSVKKGMPGTVVAGISPKSDGRDPFRERVTVGFEPLPDGLSFGEYAEKNFDVLLTRLRATRELDRGEIDLYPGRAAELELSHRSTGERTVLRVVMVPSGGKVFTLICAGQDPEYQSFRPTFERILNSFASPVPPDHSGSIR